MCLFVICKYDFCEVGLQCNVLLYMAVSFFFLSGLQILCSCMNTFFCVYH